MLAEAQRKLAEAEASGDAAAVERAAAEAEAARAANEKEEREAEEAEAVAEKEQNEAVVAEALAEKERKEAEEAEAVAEKEGKEAEEAEAVAEKERKEAEEAEAVADVMREAHQKEIDSQLAASASHPDLMELQSKIVQLTTQNEVLKERLGNLNKQLMEIQMSALEKPRQETEQQQKLAMQNFRRALVGMMRGVLGASLHAWVQNKVNAAIHAATDQIKAMKAQEDQKQAAANAKKAKRRALELKHASDQHEMKQAAQSRERRLGREKALGGIQSASPTIVSGAASSSNPSEVAALKLQLDHANTKMRHVKDAEMAQQGQLRAKQRFAATRQMQNAFKRLLFGVISTCLQVWCLHVARAENPMQAAVEGATGAMNGALKRIARCLSQVMFSKAALAVRDWESNVISAKFATQMKTELEAEMQTKIAESASVAESLKFRMQQSKQSASFLRNNKDRVKTKEYLMKKVVGTILKGSLGRLIETWRRAVMALKSAGKAQRAAVNTMQRVARRMLMVQISQAVWSWQEEMDLALEQEQRMAAAMAKVGNAIKRAIRDGKAKALQTLLENFEEAMMLKEADDQAQQFTFLITEKMRAKQGAGYQMLSNAFRQVKRRQVVYTLASWSKNVAAHRVAVANQLKTRSEAHMASLREEVKQAEELRREQREELHRVRHALETASGKAITLEGG